MFKSHIKLMVMKHLSREPSSGYDLIKYFSEHGRKISSGYLYPLLEDLEKNKFISIKKIERRKVCSTTTKGKKLLKNLETKYQEMVGAMEAIGDKSEMKEFKKLKSGIEDYHLIREKEKMWEIRKLIVASLHDRKGIRKVLDETIRKLKKIKPNV